jgi:branched-chain amino acid transport system permease protein
VPRGLAGRAPDQELRPIMSTALLAVQTLNGVQLGVLLFLIAAGLTLIFGVMDFLNLGHGVQYRMGA